MKYFLIAVFFVLSFSYSFWQDKTRTINPRVKSTIYSTYINDIVLIQEFALNPELDSVWDTYTTKEGWESAFLAQKVNPHCL